MTHTPTEVLLEGLILDAAYPVGFEAGWLELGYLSGDPAPVKIGLPVVPDHSSELLADPTFAQALALMVEQATEIYDMEAADTDDLDFLDVQGDVVEGSSVNHHALVDKAPMKNVVAPTISASPPAVPFQESPPPTAFVGVTTVVGAGVSVALKELPPLWDAQELGQLVQGTSKPYRYVARNEYMKAAYAIDNGTLSIRIEQSEGDLLTLAGAHLKTVGFKMGTGGKYASIHVDVGGDMLLCRKSIGAILFAAADWEAFGPIPA